MDNDSRIKKSIANFYRNEKVRFSFLGKNILGNESGNNYIFDKILDGKPFMVGRLGATESKCVTQWLCKKSYETENIQNIKQLSGFYPNDPKSIDHFCDLYTASFKNSDMVAVWGVKGEKMIVNEFSPKAQLTEILALEPYFYSKPWTLALRGKKVLIVHPFVHTIRKQLKYKDMLFEHEVLPDFSEISYLQAIQSIGGSDDFESWFAALEYMKCEMLKADFDVAIIGAGAYGMPLAAFAKSIGKQAILMAGATQILFGVKGKRWEFRGEYKFLFNEYWVYPMNIDTPKNKEMVEGGSYWG